MQPEVTFIVASLQPEVAFTWLRGWGIRPEVAFTWLGGDWK